MKKLLRVLYVVVILAGLTTIGVILLQSKSACIKAENVCLRYPADWKKADLGTDKVIRLIKSKPGAVLQLSVSNNKISGNTVENVVAAIDTQLKKNVNSYKFIKAEHLIINKISSVSVTYELAQSTGGRILNQELIVAPVGDKTYVFTVEAAPSDMSKLSGDIDYILSHTEVKR
jgi:hypothetical protein